MASESKPVSRSTWIASTIFAIVACVFLVVGFVPWWQATWQLSRDIREYRAQIETGAAQSEQLRDLTNKASFMMKETRNYPRLVPATKDLGLFLGQLSQKLDQAGMRDTAVRALPPTLLGKCSQLPIEVHSSGNFEQFHDFLEQLENLPRMSSINRLEVKSDDSMSGKVTVDLTLSIYSTHDN